MNPARVGDALRRIEAEVEYAQTELQKFKRDGNAHPLIDEASAAFQAIRHTLQFDVRGEYDTLLQKLGLGPVCDEHAHGPPAVNSRFVLDWMWHDLAALDTVIRRSNEPTGPSSDAQEGRIRATLSLLLRVVGTEMLTEFAVLKDELEPVAKR